MPDTLDPKTLVQRMFDEVINQGRVDLVDQYFAEDFLDHGPLGDMRGRDTFSALVTAWRDAFPDVHCEVSHLIVEGDTVAWLVHTTGTHTGGGLGFPATGKRIDTLSVNLGRIRDGKAVEHWADQGMLATLQQVGVIPAMAPPAAIAG
jgi:steroid delta-isomerase-like uncharacterized protein